MLEDSRTSLNYGLMQGDGIAFHVIYRKHFAQLRAYAMRYVYDVEIAQDIVQDAFLSLWKTSNRYDPRKEVFPYLLAIVKNHCINYLRSMKIEDSHRDKIIEALLFAQIEDVEIDEGIKERLNAVLKRLPAKGYETLIAHIVDRKKVKEIAKEMNVAESTVKTHLRRAMKFLRKELLFILIGV